MENNENNEMNTQPPKYDPAGETKQKIIFFVAAIAVLIVLKFVMGQ
ncbi:MAG: hypothetical protein Kow0029_13730 [Candidatus Rifleibacteriota bacterium]